MFSDKLFLVLTLLCISGPVHAKGNNDSSSTGCQLPTNDGDRCCSDVDCVRPFDPCEIKQGKCNRGQQGKYCEYSPRECMPGDACEPNGTCTRQSEVSFHVTVSFDNRATRRFDATLTNLTDQPIVVSAYDWANVLVHTYEINGQIISPEYVAIDLEVEPTRSQVAAIKLLAARGQPGSSVTFPINMTSLLLYKKGHAARQEGFRVAQKTGHTEIIFRYRYFPVSSSPGYGGTLLSNKVEFNAE